MTIVLRLAKNARLANLIDSKGVEHMPFCCIIVSVTISRSELFIDNFLTKGVQICFKNYIHLKRKFLSPKCVTMTLLLRKSGKVDDLSEVL